MHRNFCYTKTILYSNSYSLYVIATAIPPLQGARGFNVYGIFSNTMVGMHRKGCSFTSQIMMRYRTFRTLNMKIYCIWKLILHSAAHYAISCSFQCNKFSYCTLPLSLYFNMITHLLNLPINVPVQWPTKWQNYSKNFGFQTCLVFYSTCLCTSSSGQCLNIS